MFVLWLTALGSMQMRAEFKLFECIIKISNSEPTNLHDNPGASYKISIFTLIIMFLCE